LLKIGMTATRRPGLEAPPTPGVPTALDLWTLSDRVQGAPPEAEWVRRAQLVATQLAGDVVERDLAGAAPFAEADLLRRADLLRLLVPEDLGGHGQPFRTGLEVVRQIARVDSSVAHFLAYHYLFQTRMDSDVDVPYDGLKERSAEKGWIIGSTGNVLDPDLVLEPMAGGYRLNGAKTFATAARVADRILGFVIDPATGERVVVEIDPARGGVRFLDDWDILGQRLSASNGLVLDNYELTSEEVLASLGRDDDPAKSPRRTLSVLSFQLAFVWLYLGIAEGALLAARDYTRTRARAWIHAAVDTPTEDPYVISTYGDLVSQVLALSALSERAERAADWALRRGEELTARERAEAANLGAAAKVIATRTVLDVTSRVFETTGTRSTKRDVGLDLFWRNARTHTLHSPVAYKLEEVGRMFLNDTLATPSEYR
jgi:alkylation response protein AidB-like acyl-CoA dehydrogenase